MSETRPPRTFKEHLITVLQGLVVVAVAGTVGGVWSAQQFVIGELTRDDIRLHALEDEVKTDRAERLVWQSNVMTILMELRQQMGELQGQRGYQKRGEIPSPDKGG